jgi:biopolymer transport protein ExbD
MAHFTAKPGAVMASPNVIPMADIMLVLLIIFMVVTPLIRNPVPVDLAKVNNPVEMPKANSDDAIVVAITRDGATFLGTTKLALGDISSHVRDLMTARLDRTVFIKSDAGTKYIDLVRLVDEVRSAGVDEVGLLTEKFDANRQSVTPEPPRD